LNNDLASLRGELHAKLAARALRFGDFVLTSGRRSDYYIDGKQVTLDGRGLYLVARLGLEHCNELGVDAVGGLTLGADPIAAGIAALSGAGVRPLTAFIVRKDAKAHGTGKQIEGPPVSTGMRVLLVDDTLTTGGTFLQANEALQETGATVVGALCVVDREEGGREALEDAGIPLRSLFTRSEFKAPTTV
jgi:orotate phosphoribosyltransferase